MKITPEQLERAAKISFPVWNSIADALTWEELDEHQRETWKRAILVAHAEMSRE